MGLTISILTNKVFLIIIGLVLTAFGIVFYVVPAVQQWIATAPVWVNFIFFYFIIFGIIEIVLFIILPMKIASFRFAAGGTLILMAIDLILPAYAVDMSGKILSSQATGYFGSIDYVLGTYWHSIGVSGVYLYLCVYVVSFAILLIAALFLLGGSKFIKAVAAVVPK